MDSADDPAEAADALQSTLFEYGLGPDVHCPSEEAGNWLIASNTSVAGCLSRLGLLDNLETKRPEEMAIAREVIESDTQTHRERLAQILSSWPVPNALTAFVQSRLENASLLADSVTKGNMFPREGAVRAE